MNDPAEDWEDRAASPGNDPAPLPREETTEVERRPEFPQQEPSASSRVGFQVELVDVPGPGLPEALVWFVAIVLFQFACSIAIGLTLSIVAAVLGEKVSSQVYLRVITAGTLGLFLLAAIVAVRLRLGRGTARKLSLRRISIPHALLSGCVVLPAAIVCSQMGWWARNLWDRLVVRVPRLEWFDALDAMQQIQEMVATTPFLVLLLMVAVVPAISEELLFRGMLGRGLMARWGIWKGIAITSILFCAVHLHPVHAISLLPLAFVMQTMHLATRSFAAPVAIHFLNNSLALLVAFGQSSVDAEPHGMAELKSLPPVLWISALVCVFAIVRVVWRTRVEFRSASGEAWSPGFPTAETPPVPHARPISRKTQPRDWLFAVAAILTFFAVFAWESFATAASEVF